MGIHWQPTGFAGVELDIRNGVDADEEYSMTGRPELPKILSVKVRPHCKLEIQWQHGETSAVDLRGLIEGGGIFDPLRDPDLFATVQVGDRGRYLEWRDPTSHDHVLADLDADTLIRQGDNQQAGSLLNRLLKTIRNQLVHQTKEPA